MRRLDTRRRVPQIMPFNILQKNPFTFARRICATANSNEIWQKQIKGAPKMQKISHMMQ